MLTIALWLGLGASVLTLVVVDKDPAFRRWSTVSNIVLWLYFILRG